MKFLTCFCIKCQAQIRNHQFHHFDFLLNYFYGMVASKKSRRSFFWPTIIICFSITVILNKYSQTITSKLNKDYSDLQLPKWNPNMISTEEILEQPQGQTKIVILTYMRLGLLLRFHF